MQGKKGTKKDKEKFLKALAKRKGIVTLACKEAGIDPKTFYNWQKTDPDFYQQSEETRDIEIGIVAEDVLAEAIIAKRDTNMVKFYLQSRNKRYMPKLQTEEVKDETLELAKLMSISNERKPKTSK
jgi:hypothetical protein